MFFKERNNVLCEQLAIARLGSLAQDGECAWHRAEIPPAKRNNLLDILHLFEYLKLLFDGLVGDFGFECALCNVGKGKVDMRVRARNLFDRHCQATKVPYLAD
jgi:hypothetical protein